MAILVEVFDAAGNRLGKGPIRTTTAASVTRVLDGCGSFTVDLPGTDERALDLIQPKRRVRVLLWDEQDNQRQLVEGIVESIGAKDDSSGWVLTVDGPDLLAELKFTNVLLGRIYDADSVQDIVDDLLGLTSGWTRSGNNTDLLSVRLDGASILKALQSVVQQQGIHFRQGSTAGTLEIGAFGVSNGLRIINAPHVRSDLAGNDDVLLIESFIKLQDSESLVNWLLPLGAGEGDAMLSLEFSTRTTPYTIQSTTGPDGRTLYYLENSASITSYGQVEKIGTFKDITPIGTSAAAVEAAANALYDTAVAWLDRYKDPYESYSVTVRKPRTNILPGDKIHVRYKGLITNDMGELVTYRDINSDFFIMEVAEIYGPRGTQLRLKIANIDRYEVDNARVVIGALEDIRINNVSVKPYFSHYTYVDQFEIDSSNNVTFELNVTNAVQAINRVVLRVVTSPFRALASGAASGGGSTSGSGGGSAPTSSATAHRHVWAVRDETYEGGFTVRQYRADNPSGGFVFFELPTSESLDPLRSFNESPEHTHTVTIPSHTHSVPAHTHNLNYGINDDTDFPDSIGILVNSQVVGIGLDSGGTGLDTEIDITDEINSVATLQAAHPIVISCSGGQGLVKVYLDVYETIQTISVFS